MPDTFFTNGDELQHNTPPKAIRKRTSARVGNATVAAGGSGRAKRATMRPKELFLGCTVLPTRGRVYLTNCTVRVTARNEHARDAAPESFNSTFNALPVWTPEQPPVVAPMTRNHTIPAGLEATDVGVEVVATSLRTVGGVTMYVDKGSYDIVTKNSKTGRHGAAWRMCEESRPFATS